MRNGLGVAKAVAIALAVAWAGLQPAALAGPVKKAGSSRPVKHVAPVVASEAQPRLHVLSAKLQKRVMRNKPGQMTANLDAIGIFQRKNGRQGGTAFLLTKPDASGFALMLTNHHVAQYQKKAVKGDAVLFHPGGNRRKPVAADVDKVVTSSLRFDYALLRVRLPNRLRSLKPVQLHSDHYFESDIAVYNPSFPRVSEHETFTPKHLQVGRTQGYGLEGLEAVALPHRLGSSGSPVFSQKSHKVLGIMNAGDGHWLGLVRPMGDIVRDWQRSLRKINNPKTHLQVKQLIDSARGN